MMELPPIPSQKGKANVITIPDLFTPRLHLGVIPYHTRALPYHAMIIPYPCTPRLHLGVVTIPYPPITIPVIIIFYPCTPRLHSDAIAIPYLCTPMQLPRSNPRAPFAN